MKSKANGACNGTVMVPPPPPLRGPGEGSKVISMGICDGLPLAHCQCESGCLLLLRVCVRVSVCLVPGFVI